MKVGVIGLGHVGQAMAELLAPHADLVTYDPQHHASYPVDELTDADFAVVCVGTPADVDGRCDLSHVNEAVQRVPADRILVKSTIVPGTTDDLIERTGKQICFSPEYVGETRYPVPEWPAGMHSVPFAIFGGQPEIRRYFIDRFMPVLGPDKTYFQCTATEAELIKYMENAFLATKVTFVNEFFELCSVLGVDWNTVREGWLLDSRIGRSHSAVFADQRGFGGRCLPKDVKAIVRHAAALGYGPELLEEVLRSNERFRAPS